MFVSKKRSRQSATLLGAIIGLMVIFTFVIALINPNIGSQSSDSSESQPLATPEPTRLVVPTPDPDPQLGGERPYIHSSGLFQTFRPAGEDWVIDERLPGESTPTTTSLARVVIQSGTRLVVIHNYIQPGKEYESLESLSQNFITAEHFAQDWYAYDRWQEVSRTVTESSVVVTLDLEYQTAKYRAISTYQLAGDWLMVSRLVVPANNPGLLDLLQQLMGTSFVLYDELLALPLEWPAYIDQQLGTLFKRPAAWEVVAGGEGRPVTFADSAGLGRVYLLTVPDRALTSAEEAEAWVTEQHPDASILGSAPVEHQHGSGFEVAYRYRDEKGDTHSGLMVLLNDADGTLYAANAQIDPPDVNLLDEAVLSGDLLDIRRAVVEGFIVLPESATQVTSAT